MARTALIALMIVACAMGAHARVLLQGECSAVGPTNPTNGAYDCTLPKSLNDVCTATCDANYQGSTVTATCGGDGSWTYSSTACTPTPCSTEPAPPANGEFATACGTTNVDGTCAGRCSAGYDGTVSATCVLGGTWDVSGTCTLIQCGALPDNPTNGAFAAESCALPKGNTQTCTATCDNGYDGTVTATCGATGWLVTGSCNQILCTSSPANPDNGVFSCDPTAPTGTCTAQCADGYRPNSEAGVTAACGDDGQWLATQGTCNLIECDANTFTGSPPAYGDLVCPVTTHDESCRGTCAEGYKGAVSVACGAQGTWGQVVSTCERIECEGSPNSDGTTFTCASSLYGDQCTGTCTLGYNNSPGTPTATCGSDGQWRVENACIKNRCSGSPTTDTGAVFSCGTSSPINNVCTGKCSGKCKGAPPKSRCDINGNWGPVEGDCSSCTPSGRG